MNRRLGALVAVVAAGGAAATAYEVLGVWGLVVFAAPVAGIRHAYFHGARGAEGEGTDLSDAA